MNILDKYFLVDKQKSNKSINIFDIHIQMKTLNTYSLLPEFCSFSFQFIALLK